MSEVQFWRYVLPPEKDGLQGWAIVVMDSIGFFGVVSDYGNYAYLWDHRGAGVGMREFVAGLDGDYVRRKLDPSTSIDLAATKERLSIRLQSRLAEYRRIEPKHSAVFVGDPTSLGDVSTEFELYEWAEQYGDLADFSWEEVVRSPPAPILAFTGRVLPRLQQMIRDELAIEKEEARE